MPRASGGWWWVGREVGEGPTADVDFLHRLVFGLQFHLDRGPEEHVLALQAVEAAGT